MGHFWEIFEADSTTRAQRGNQNPVKFTAVLIDLRRVKREARLRSRAGGVRLQPDSDSAYPASPVDDVRSAREAPGCQGMLPSVDTTTRVPG